MVYWVRSVPPLVIRKAFLESTTEVMEWMDYVIKLSKEKCDEEDKPFPPKEGVDIFKDGFLLINISRDNEGHMKKIFRMDIDSAEWLESRRRDIPNLKKIWKKIRKSRTMKLGLPRRILPDMKKKIVANTEKSSFSIPKKIKVKRKNAL